MSLPPDKGSLRRHFRRRRQQTVADATPGLREVARSQLPALLPPGRWLGLYWPVGSEPDLDPWGAGGLAAHLAEAGSEPRLALPAVLPAAAGAAHGRLLYLPWRRNGPLVADACGIPAPQPPPGEAPRGLPPESLGLLLVPALALDRAAIRLGSGGGWYDRLRADASWRAVPALAVLPAACHTARLPRDPWDVPFSGWMDERGVGTFA